MSSHDRRRSLSARGVGGNRLRGRTSASTMEILSLGSCCRDRPAPARLGCCRALPNSPHAAAAPRALRDATRQACDFRITPSASTLRWLARSVEPGRGDVDDDVGQPRRRRALGGAQALDDAVDLDAVLLREELLGEPPVFGGDPAAAGRGAGGNRRRRRRDRPSCRRRARHRAPQPRRRRGRSRAAPTISARASQSASVSRSRSSPVTPRSMLPAPSSLAISEADRKLHLDVGAAGNARAVFALVGRQLDGQPGAAEQVERLFAQPALRWQRQGQRHAPPPRNCSMRSSQTEKPTPGIGFCAPSSVSRRS